MPLLRVTYQKGTLTHEQKLQLAEELTPVLVAGEVGVDNPPAGKPPTCCSTNWTRRPSGFWGASQTPMRPRAAGSSSK